MAKDPESRPADAASLVTELNTIASRAYGQDWERRGRSHLGEAALLLAALWPSARRPRSKAPPWSGSSYPRADSLAQGAWRTAKAAIWTEAREACGA